MKDVLLPNGRRTSRLGLGCARLFGGHQQRATERIVGAAIDAGITHFDTAPSYGLGTSEDALGRCLQSYRDVATVTTKIGIGRPPAPSLIPLARRFLRPLFFLMPGVRQKLGHRAYALSPRSQFGIDKIRASLQESLRSLRTDHIDLLLLHEAAPLDVTDELLRFLEDEHRNGSIGGYGLATSWEPFEEIAASCRALTNVVQLSWTIQNSARKIPSDFVLRHSALQSLQSVHEWFAVHAEERTILSNETGLDLSAVGDCAKALLGAVLSDQNNQVVLVSSTEPRRIAENAAAARSDGVLAAGAALLRLARLPASQIGGPVSTDLEPLQRR